MIATSSGRNAPKARGPGFLARKDVETLSGPADRHSGAFVGTRIVTMVIRGALNAKATQGRVARNSSSRHIEPHRESHSKLLLAGHSLDRGSSPKSSCARRLGNHAIDFRGDSPRMARFRDRVLRFRIRNSNQRKPPRLGFSRTIRVPSSASIRGKGVRAA